MSEHNEQPTNDEPVADPASGPAVEPFDPTDTDHPVGEKQAAENEATESPA